MPKLLLVLLLAAVTPAAAQTFRLTDPALTIDGRRVGVVGSPLAQERFGVLSISVPSTGVYQISAQPFDGARAAGQFDGDGLYFTVDGRSLRLRSAGPMLGGNGPATAFVRFDVLPPGLFTRGLTRVSVSGTPRTAEAPATLSPEAPGSRAADRQAAQNLAEAELEATRRRLEERQADLDAAQARLEAMHPTEVRSTEALRAENGRLRRQFADVQAERDAIRLQLNVMEHERDALRASVERLTAGLVEERLEARPNMLPDGSDVVAPVPEARMPRGVSLPSFDPGRLRNAEAIRRRLDETPLPASAVDARIEGDVLVLLETDRDGRVIRTAVPSPIGGGLDGLAEALVREMVFVPPTVGGRPTGLRSQVTVRFRR